MSREMKGKEIDEFEKKFGYKPTPVRVAVDAAFSKSARRGGKPAAAWGQLGLAGDWANRPISLYGRNSASGTYGFFKELVLEKGDFRDEVKEQPGSASVVQSLSVDRFGMGYSGIGYKTSGVRALPLSEQGANYVEATVENSLTGDYPLARFLYVYVNKAPGKPLDPLTREFLKLVLSREGQEVVVKGGYFPIPGAVASEELAAIGGAPMTR